MRDEESVKGSEETKFTIRKEENSQVLDVSMTLCSLEAIGEKLAIGVPERLKQARTEARAPDEIHAFWLRFAEKAWPSIIVRRSCWPCSGRQQHPHQSKRSVRGCLHLNNAVRCGVVAGDPE